MATDDRDDDDYHDYGEYVFVDAGVFVRRFVCGCSMLHVLHVSGAMLHLSFDFVAPRVQSS